MDDAERMARSFDKVKQWWTEHVWRGQRADREAEKLLHQVACRHADCRWLEDGECPDSCAEHRSVDEALRIQREWAARMVQGFRCAKHDQRDEISPFDRYDKPFDIFCPFCIEAHGYKRAVEHVADMVEDDLWRGGLLWGGFSLSLVSRKKMVDFIRSAARF